VATLSEHFGSSLLLIMSIPLVCLVVKILRSRNTTSRVPEMGRAEYPGASLPTMSLFIVLTPTPIESTTPQNRSGSWLTGWDRGSCRDEQCAED
jgi:hypothetical protein